MDIFLHKGIEEESEYRKKENLEEDIGKKNFECLCPKVPKVFRADRTLYKLFCSGDNPLKCRIFLDTLIDKVPSDLCTTPDNNLLSGNVYIFSDSTIQIDFSSGNLCLTIHYPVEVDIAGHDDQIFSDIRFLSDIDISACYDHISGGSTTNPNTSSCGPQIIPDTSSNVERSSNNYHAL